MELLCGRGGESSWGKGLWCCVSSAWSRWSTDPNAPQEPFVRLLNGVVLKMNTNRKVSEEGSNNVEIIMLNASELSIRQWQDDG